MKNGDKPAHPLNGEKYQNELGHGIAYDTYKGLTKRELFAAMAMQGICASPTGDKYHVNEGWLHPGTVASNAIEIADELLKQLES